MTRPRVPGTSRALSELDQRKRELAWAIVRQSSETVVGFARLMVPTALSALGVVVALAGTVFGGSGHGGQRLLIGLCCIVVIVATLVFAHACYARRLPVSVEDYQHVLDELATVNAARRRETSIGLGLLAVGLLAASAVLLFTR